MRNLEGAKCAGQFELFDSRHMNDHMEARELCKTCPVILTCAALLRDVQDAATGGAAGGPGGTWAGRLVGEQRAKRRAKCGTDTGYSHHRRNGEEACAACKEGHRAAERARYAAKNWEAS